MVELQGKTLYEALGVARDASKAEVRKAFHRLALQLHPDKNPGDESAKDKFQTLQKVYGILNDDDKRKLYDQTGSIDDAEELAGDKFSDLYDYYRTMYAKVTEAEVEAFYRQYVGSEAEHADLLRYYQQFRGNMDMVFQYVMCSDERADSHRFMDLVNAAIAAKQVPSYPKYTAWAKKMAARPRPAAAAAKGAKGRARRQEGAGQGADQQSSEAALIARIRGRQHGAAGVLDSLAARYGVPHALQDEVPEEAFEAARQRLLQKRGKGGAAAATQAGTEGGGGSRRGNLKAAAPAAAAAAAAQQAVQERKVTGSKRPRAK